MTMPFGPDVACGIRHWDFCHIDGSTHDRPHEHGEGCIYTYPDCDDEQGPRHPGDELDPTARVGWPTSTEVDFDPYQHCSHCGGLHHFEEACDA